MRRKLNFTKLCPISGQSPLEETFNSFSHGLGLLLSIIGAIFLIQKAYYLGSLWDLLASVVYATTLVLLYAASTIYHACSEEKRKLLWQRLDHIGIYLLIAGSYTPFLLGPLRQNVGFKLLALVWSCAIIGTIMKVFYKQANVISLVAPYLFMGLLVFFVISPVKACLAPAGFFALMAGGFFYISGIIFFALERHYFTHAIWHLFVLLGSACHYYCIMQHVIAPKTLA